MNTILSIVIYSLLLKLSITVGELFPPEFDQGEPKSRFLRRVAEQRNDIEISLQDTLSGLQSVASFSAEVHNALRVERDLSQIDNLNGLEEAFPIPDASSRKARGNGADLSSELLSSLEYLEEEEMEEEREGRKTENGEDSLRIDREGHKIEDGKKEDLKEIEKVEEAKAGIEKDRGGRAAESNVASSSVAPVVSITTTVASEHVLFPQVGGCEPDGKTCHRSASCCSEFCSWTRGFKCHSISR